MKNVFLLFLLLPFSNVWGLSLNCPQRDEPRLEFPAKHIEWIIEEGDDGINGYIFKVPVVINNLEYISANLLISGVTEADYLVPLSVDLQMGLVKAGFYAPKSKIGSVVIKLVYGEKTDLCGSNNVLYSLSYGKTKT